MKPVNGRVSTVGIFFAATVLLIGYLLSIRWNIYLPVPLFWLAIVLMIGTIVYQCFRFKLSSGYAGVVLAEIAVACVALHLIYQVPYYGLRGFDVYIDMASAQGILPSGFVMGDQEHINTTGAWPMVHILGAELSLITGIELFAVVKWFPAFMGAGLVLLLFLLVRNAFKNEKAALFSTLLFSCLHQYILFGSLFIRETIAVLLMICCLYLYFSARSSPHPAACYALSVMCLAGTTFAHHFTSFMLALFLLVHFFVAHIASIPAVKKRYFPNGIVGQKVGIVFLSLALVLPVAFWASGGIQAPSVTNAAASAPGETTAIVGEDQVTIIAGGEPERQASDGHPSIPGPIAALLKFLRNLFSGYRWGDSYAALIGLNFGDILTLRGRVVFLGFWFFVAMFGAMLLFRLLPSQEGPRLEVYSFTLFLLTCGLAGVVALYGVRMDINPDRLLTFGFLFGIPALVIATLQYRRRWLRASGIAFLAAFMLFNVYWIEQTAWDARAEGLAAATTEQDYALARRFSFSYGTIAGHQNSVMAIYHLHRNMGTRLVAGSRVDLGTIDWVIVHKEFLELEMRSRDEPRTEMIAQLQQLAEDGCPSKNRIYESSALALFRRAGAHS